MPAGEVLSRLLGQKGLDIAGQGGNQLTRTSARRSPHTCLSVIDCRSKHNPLAKRKCQIDCVRDNYTESTVELGASQAALFRTGYGET